MDRNDWDEDKNAENRLKHGISFPEAIQIFDGPVLTKADDRFEYGELRETSFGFLGGAIVVCVAHTERYGRIRLISARRATKKERRLFDAYLQRTLG